MLNFLIQNREIGVPLEMGLVDGVEIVLVVLLQGGRVVVDVRGRGVGVVFGANQGFVLRLVCCVVELGFSLDYRRLLVLRVLG